MDYKLVGVLCFIIIISGGIVFYISPSNHIVSRYDFEMQCIEKYGADTIFGKERVPLSPNFNDSYMDVVFGIENGTDYMYWCSGR